VIRDVSIYEFTFGVVMKERSNDTYFVIQFKHSLVTEHCCISSPMKLPKSLKSKGPSYQRKKEPLYVYLIVTKS